MQQQGVISLNTNDIFITLPDDILTTYIDDFVNDGTFDVSDIIQSSKDNVPSNIQIKNDLFDIIFSIIHILPYDTFKQIIHKISLIS